jgi:phosphoribosylformylglycinamidine cyclo-ligase
VGVADRSKFVNGKRIAEGDAVIGLESSGLHTNGYSLARKVLFDKAGYSVSDVMEGSGKSMGEVLLEPHVSYSKAVLGLMKHADVRGIAHITGGGFLENIPRILPSGLSVRIEKGRINRQEIFTLIQEKGAVPEEEMYRTFNMGIGLVVIVPEKEAEAAIGWLAKSGHRSYRIGVVVKGGGKVELI